MACIQVALSPQAITLTCDIKQPGYLDKDVVAGAMYYYTVTASNENGESKNGYETAIASGLPSPWQQQDIGKSRLKGSTSFDGNIFTMEGMGMGVNSTNDETHFAYQPLQGDGEIVVRFVPQPSSQFSKMGLMIRDGLDDKSPFVSLLIYPGKTGQIEAPNWHARLMTRSATREKAAANHIGPSLAEPAVTWGRLTGYVWLRLKRTGNNFTGATSYDGKTWTVIGTATVPLKGNALIGLSASSGMRNSTTVFFDCVGVLKNKE